MSETLRLTFIDDGAHQFPGSVWWYVRAEDTGVQIAIENPRPEIDGDEDGTFVIYEWDRLMIVTEIVDGTPHLRETTDEEDDEYSDDVREFLRHSDWS